MLDLIGAILLWVGKIVLVLFLLAVITFISALTVVSIDYWKAYISIKKSWPYDRLSTRILWAYTIITSASITAMLLLAFLNISDAAGFYLLWPPSALIGYFVVAFVIATNLHRYWTDGAVWDLESSPASPASSEGIVETQETQKEQGTEEPQKAVDKAEEPPVGSTVIVKE